MKQSKADNKQETTSLLVIVHKSIWAKNWELEAVFYGRAHPSWRGEVGDGYIMNWSKKQAVSGRMLVAQAADSGRMAVNDSCQIGSGGVQLVQVQRSPLALAVPTPMVGVRTLESKSENCRHLEPLSRCEPPLPRYYGKYPSSHHRPLSHPGWSGSGHSPST